MSFLLILIISGQIISIEDNSIVFLWNYIEHDLHQARQHPNKTCKIKQIIISNHYEQYGLQQNAPDPTAHF